MKIIVNKNYVLFDVNTKVNKREFKATPLEFSFSEEYEGLTCKCVFSKIPATQDEEVTFYQQPIIDDKCYIPYEVMDAEGILIGVYGYSVDGDKLLLRYSPKPKNLWFLEGSYYEGAETPEEILPSQFEQYVAYLNSQITRLDQMKIETEDLSNGVKISITNSNGITTETTIYDGEPGPEGPEGPEGPAGRDGYVQYTAGSNINITNDVISATNTTYTAGSNISISEQNVISADLSSKQDLLISGTNIKTINNTSLLGSGNIETEVIQVTSLPQPQAMETGKIYQYIGSDTVDYTKGYFYECKLVNNVYTWVNINVQPASSGGNDEIIFTYNDTTNNLINGQKVIDYYRANNKLPEARFFGYTTISSAQFWEYVCLADEIQTTQRRLTYVVFRVSSQSNNYFGTPIFTFYGRITISYDSSNVVADVSIQGDTTSKNGFLRSGKIALVYDSTLVYPSNRESYVKACVCPSIENTTAYTPAVGSYNPATAKYVDDKPTTYSGYDATKTQVLKNINGTLTWVDEV